MNTNFTSASYYPSNPINMVPQCQQLTDPIQKISAASSEPFIQTPAELLVSLNYYPLPQKAINQPAATQPLKKPNPKPKHFTPKANFTPEEDELLLQTVKQHGTRDWHKIALNLPGRNTRQCRERWNNYVNPEISSMCPWTPEDDDLLMKKYDEIGPKWHLLSTFFTGRSTNSIKNRFIMLKRRRNRKLLTETMQAPTDPKCLYPPMYMNNMLNIIPPTQLYMNLIPTDFIPPKIRDEPIIIQPNSSIEPASTNVVEEQQDNSSEQIDLAKSATENDPFAFMDLTKDVETISWSNGIDVMSSDWINTSEFW